MEVAKTLPIYDMLRSHVKFTLMSIWDGYYIPIISTIVGMFEDE